MKELDLLTFIPNYILPTVYDKAISYDQKLQIIKDKINEIIKSQNGLNDQFKNLLTWIDEQLEMYSKEQLQTWLDDGTLKKLINETLFQSKIGKYNIVEEMIDDESLTLHQVCETNGYYNVNDGGNAKYLITENKNNYSHFEELKNGLFAMLIIDDVINVKKIGAKGDGINDDTIFLKEAISLCGGENNILIEWNNMKTAYKLYIPKGVYIISSALEIRKNNINICGDGCYNTIIRNKNFSKMEVMLLLSEAYGCSLSNFMLDGGIKYDDITSLYGVDCGLWLDQVAYLNCSNIIITNTRLQGIRCCHLWESYFEDIKIYYCGAYGDTSLNLKSFATGIYFASCNKLSNKFPSAESNELVFNKLSVTGMYGGTLTIDSSAPVQNIYLNDVIEENSSFNWLDNPTLGFNNDCYYIAGLDTYFHINGHYVGIKPFKFSVSKNVYNIQGGIYTTIKNSMVIATNSNSQNYSYNNIVYNVSPSSVILDIILYNSLSATKVCNYFVNNISQFNVTSRSSGSLSYYGNEQIDIKSLFNDITRFVGNFTIRQNDGVNIYNFPAKTLE